MFLVLASSNLPPRIARADELVGPYVRDEWYHAVRFGQHSHWIQPWRSYLPTVAASVLVDAVGMGFNVDAAHTDNVARMLAAHGVHHGRVEIGWGAFDARTEDRLVDPSIVGKLRALRRYGIRPLILLNANSLAPCPMRRFAAQLLDGARRGQRRLSLVSVDGLRAGYSALELVGDAGSGARVLIVALHGHVAMLAKPLPNDLAAGASIGVATYTYRPFGRPDGAAFEATLAGWQRYVINCARIARRSLGTKGERDGGFDIEIWNELTFGSDFLEPDATGEPLAGPNWTVGERIVGATAMVARQHPELFSGVKIGDGFANTTPWPASSREPARIAAIDKHPYPPSRAFPAGDQSGTSIDAQGQVTSFVPTYIANFPEYYGTAIQTETLIRDCGPRADAVGGTLHGRNERVVNGRRLPVAVWITEFNIPPVVSEPAISALRAGAIKAKVAARALTFFVNKGVDQIDFYTAIDRDTRFGMVADRFAAYRGPYPADDRPYLSAPLRVIGRIFALMRRDIDRRLTRLRSIGIDRLTTPDDRTIFHGDGSAGRPDLRAVDVFAFLPYEVNAGKFVVPFYVMTRDVMRSWPAERFDLSISGFSRSARFRVYDPFTDRTTAIRARACAAASCIELDATDQPRLLVVDDPPPATQAPR